MQCFDNCIEFVSSGTGEYPINGVLVRKNGDTFIFENRTKIDKKVTIRLSDGAIRFLTVLANPEARDEDYKLLPTQPLEQYFIDDPSQLEIITDRYEISGCVFYNATPKNIKLAVTHYRDISQRVLESGDVSLVEKLNSSDGIKVFIIAPDEALLLNQENIDGKCFKYSLQKKEGFEEIVMPFLVMKNTKIANSKVSNLIVSFKPDLDYLLRFDSYDYIFSTMFGFKYLTGWDGSINLEFEADFAKCDIENSFVSGVVDSRVKNSGVTNADRSEIFNSRIISAKNCTIYSSYVQWVRECEIHNSTVYGSTQNCVIKNSRILRVIWYQPDALLNGRGNTYIDCVDHSNPDERYYDWIVSATIIRGSFVFLKDCISEGAKIIETRFGETTNCTIEESFDGTHKGSTISKRAGGGTHDGCEISFISPASVTVDGVIKRSEPVAKDCKIYDANTTTIIGGSVENAVECNSTNATIENMYGGEAFNCTIGIMSSGTASFSRIYEYQGGEFAGRVTVDRIASYLRAGWNQLVLITNWSSVVLVGKTPADDFDKAILAGAKPNIYQLRAVLRGLGTRNPNSISSKYFKGVGLMKAIHHCDHTIYPALHIPNNKLCRFSYGKTYQAIQDGYLPIFSAYFIDRVIGSINGYAITETTADQMQMKISPNGNKTVVKSYRTVIKTPVFKEGKFVGYTYDDSIYTLSQLLSEMPSCEVSAPDERSPIEIIVGDDKMTIDTCVDGRKFVLLDDNGMAIVKNGTYKIGGRWIYVEVKPCSSVIWLPDLPSGDKPIVDIGIGEIVGDDIVSVSDKIPIDGNENGTKEIGLDELKDNGKVEKTLPALFSLPPVKFISSGIYDE